MVTIYLNFFVREVKMARKSGKEDPDQLGFDFTFNHVVETADRLKSEEIEDDSHDRRTNKTFNNSKESSPGRNATPNPQQPAVHTSRVEDSGSLGVEFPQRTEETRVQRSDIPDDLFAFAARGRRESTDHSDSARSVEQWSDRDGNFGNIWRDDGNFANVVPLSPPPAAKNYIITSEDELDEGGAKTKFKNNIAALKTVLQLRANKRQATQEEQKILVKYVGWGGMPQAFDSANETWSKEYKELVELLPLTEYTKARRSTQDAHYTSKTIIEGIYKGLKRLGFQGGKVLEPAGGTGHFIGLMPQEIAQKSDITHVELDFVTSEIARHLYPEISQINMGYQDVFIPNNYFDVCVGNPPFGDQRIYDARNRHISNMSIHNYFMTKSIDAIRPGGIMAKVVSRFFLDANDKSAREYIAERADFLGAIRLPNTAFKKNAMTEVTTDIVFFRKKNEGEETNKDWVNVGEIRDYETGEPITINQYYIDHPEQMAGRMVISNKFFHGGVDLLPNGGERIEDAINQRLEKLPINIYQEPDPRYRNLNEFFDSKNKPELELPPDLKVGSYFVTPDGKIAARDPDEIGKSKYSFVPVKNQIQEQRIKGMIKIRDVLRELMNEERTATDNAQNLDILRRRLNTIYDSFKTKYGYINAQVNKTAMCEDPVYPLLSSLEFDYDPGISKETAKKNGVDPRKPSANKAAIFSKRVVSPVKEITQVDTSKEALIVCLNELGRVNLPRICQLVRKSHDDVVNELDDLIYRNPKTTHWETAETYLSGNVKLKLQLAQEAAEKIPSYQKNVDALLKIQPADIDAVDISVQLGSAWVPASDISDFVNHLLPENSNSISYQPALGKWSAKIHSADFTSNKTTWGTSRYPASELIPAILTNRTIQVKDTVETSEGEKQVLNEDETAAANQKAEEIKQAFLDWIWENPERRKRLHRIYNDTFNTDVVTHFDGQHLTLPGISQSIALRPHQKDVIWRGIQTGATLLDHRVGAGKTFALIGMIMESKRMGLIKKPMLVVPNHLLAQWRDDFYKLYPSANILVAEKTDFTKDKREKLFGKIATGEWDAVVVAHSSFKKIGMPEDTLNEILREQIDDLADAITEMKSAQGERVTIKQMEKIRDRMEEKLKKLSDTGSKDKSIDFADLGVDAIAVDESQEFKNLFIATSLSRIAGLGNLAGSDKAFDLFVKCRYIQNQNEGKGVFFLTGTPISNTIAEEYTVQRYMQYDTLKSKGIHHFDAWASTFGQVVTGWELDSTGVNYKLNSRFAKFQNVPELMRMYRGFADVITKKDLQDQAAAEGKRFPIPKVKTGKPQNIIVKRSREQAAYMGLSETALDYEGKPVLKADGTYQKEWTKGSIIYRMEHLPNDPSQDNPLKITNDARKAGLDFRLINPHAEDHPDSKVNTAIRKIYEIWDKWKNQKGTQLVFCDLSTPKSKKFSALKTQATDISVIATMEESFVSRDENESIEIAIQENTDIITTNKPVAEDGDSVEVESISMDEILASSSSFSVYDDIKEKLIAMGIPESEVCFIHDAKTDLQKRKLFAQVNKGEVRVLLGSTSKMGAGTNVQRRLVALHHIDAPWRPSDLEQREGRIERQGNMFYEANPDGFEIEIFRYATEQTYDSRMWQTIEFKAAGIEQFRRGDLLTRVIDDIAGEAANAAEMKAAATGNPLIFMQVKLNADLKKLEAMFSNYKRTKYSLENRVNYLKKAQERYESNKALIQDQIDFREKNRSSAFKFTVKDTIFVEANKESLSKYMMECLKSTVRTMDNLVPFGQYNGYQVLAHSFKQADGEVKVQFRLKYDGHVYEPENLRYGTKDSFVINGFFQRIDNYLKTFEDELKRIEKIYQVEKTELPNAITQYEKPFAQQEVLEMVRKDNLDIMTELKKIQADDNYVSTWKPCSFHQEETTDKPINTPIPETPQERITMSL